MKKKILPIFFIVIIYFLLTHKSYAGTDEVKLFLSDDWDRNVLAQQATVYAGRTFEKLGYKVRKNTLTSYFVTGYREPVLEYIRESGNNYAFYVFAHANPQLFIMTDGNPSTAITPEFVSGGWHLVWINGCSSMANSNFAEAFHTIGYSNRASKCCK